MHKSDALAGVILFAISRSIEIIIAITAAAAAVATIIKSIPTNRRNRYDSCKKAS